MRKKNEYSRIILDLENWNKHTKGAQIQLFHHAVENNIHSFYCSSGLSTQSLGNAFSESGLSRDEVQIIGSIEDENLSGEKFVQKVEKLLLDMRVDYLDLLVHSPGSDHLLSALKQCRTQGKIFETADFLDYDNQNINKPKDPENVIFKRFKLTPANLKTLTFRDTASEEVPKMLFLKGNISEDHEAVKKMATKYHLEPNQFLQAWLLNHPANFHLVIDGGKEEMEASEKALHTKIIEEDWNKFPKEL